MFVMKSKFSKSALFLGVCVYAVMGVASVQAQPGDAEALERARALAQAPIGSPQVSTVDAALEAVQGNAPDEAPAEASEMVDQILEKIEPSEMASPAASTATATPPPEAVIKEVEAPPMPEDVSLQAGQSAMPRPDATPATEVPTIPAAMEPEFDENLFFDAEALVPTSEISKKAAPSKVDPSLNPGSVLVVSTKTANANSIEAQLVAAERARKLGRDESALEIYQNLYAKNRRDPNVLMGRAATLQSLGRIDEAIQAYEELLAVRPKHLDARVNMQGLIGKHYPAVALRSLKDIYADNPNNPGVIAQIAVMEAKMGQYDEAIRYLGVAASMEPQNANHLFNMAVIADRAGDKKMAIQFYEEALEADTLYGASRSIPRESVFERLAQLR